MIAPMKSAFIFLLAVSAVPAWAQAPAPIESPEVHADRSVSFRYRAPEAKEVTLSLEGSDPLTMSKDEQGVWSATSATLDPDFYGYRFVVDGVDVIDPRNPLMKPNLLNTRSMVHVPGDGSQLWDVGSAARGRLNRHFYKSGIVGDDRDFYVYTPAGYDPGADERYPVLYLLHGFSDDASGWTSVGQAHVILDNLIAQGKAKPMLVVMPLGYGAPEILSRKRPRRPGLGELNRTRFRDALLTEVIPQVEKAYRVSADREQRAIAGLSMGGAESLFTGLNALDQFAWIGSFSSGGVGQDFDATFPKLDAGANDGMRLLWIACGVDDRLIESNRKLVEWLDAKGVEHAWVETSGAHSWLVWRRNLATFVSMLFQPPAS